MEKEVQKISVRIGGMSYSLVSSESEQYTRQIAARADEMIRRVVASSPQLSQQMAVVLALTNAVDELTRQATQQSLAEQQRDAAELKTTELRTELTRARELNWDLKKEMLRLKELCRQHEARLADLEKEIQFTVEPPVTEVLSGDPVINEPLASEEPSGVPSAVEPPASEAPSGDSPAAEPPGLEVPTGDPPSDAPPVDAKLDKPEDQPIQPVGQPDTERPIAQAAWRSSETIGELRQTGLEEYLLSASQFKSHVTEIARDDEP